MNLIIVSAALLKRVTFLRVLGSRNSILHVVRLYLFIEFMINALRHNVLSLPCLGRGTQVGSGETESLE